MAEVAVVVVVVVVAEEVVVYPFHSQQQHQLHCLLPLATLATTKS